MQIVIIYLTPLNFLDSLSNQIHEIGAQRKLTKPQFNGGVSVSEWQVVDTE